MQIVNYIVTHKKEMVEYGALIWAVFSALVNASNTVKTPEDWELLKATSPIKYKIYRFIRHMGLDVLHGVAPKAVAKLREGKLTKLWKTMNAGEKYAQEMMPMS